MGQRLKRLRKDRGLTQEQLAEATGIPLTSLRNYEQDHREPRLDQARRIAVALGVSLDVIAGAVKDDGEDVD